VKNGAAFAFLKIHLDLFDFYDFHTRMYKNQKDLNEILMCSNLHKGVLGGVGG